MFIKPEISSHPTHQPLHDALFSILIPSWNNLPYLQLCINSLQKNSTYKHQIIVHVNEGTDGTLEWVQSNGYDYTYSKTNAGVCYAVNAAAKLAQTNYIVYFNDDMYACPEEQKLLQFVAHHTPKADWSGACWPPSIVHIDLWNKIGGYSEEYSPGFYSDPDFAMKLWNIGVRDFKGLGKSLVYHFKCKSTGRVERNDGRTTFMKKWGFSASYLYQHVLKVGEPITSIKPLRFKKGLPYFISSLKAKLK